MARHPPHVTLLGGGASGVEEWDKARAAGWWGEGGLRMWARCACGWVGAHTTAAALPHPLVGRSHTAGQPAADARQRWHQGAAGAWSATQQQRQHSRPLALSAKQPPVAPAPATRAPRAAPAPPVPEPAVCTSPPRPPTPLRVTVRERVGDRVAGGPASVRMPRQRAAVHVWLRAPVLECSIHQRSSRGYWPAERVAGGRGVVGKWRMAGTPSATGRGPRVRDSRWHRDALATAQLLRCWAALHAALCSGQCCFWHSRLQGCGGEWMGGQARCVPGVRTATQASGCVTGGWCAHL